MVAKKRSPRPSRKSALRRYRAKRDFSQTPEPAKSRRGRGDLFVVQKHAARRLHYDFRLELGGTLKSWAVTRGPSLDPQDRRLAVHVEDHPLDYANFEGTIPQGQYGGGSVMIWDFGTWAPIGDARTGYKKGHLTFELSGRRLKGRWSLVRMRPRPSGKETRENWLLIKSNDEFARPGDADAFLESEDRSAKTHRTMDEIAGRGDRRQQSSQTPAKRPGRHAALLMTGAHLREPAQMRDKVSTKAATTVPDFIAPQLPTLVTKAPGGADWLHEIKLDGYRVHCRSIDGRCKFFTRKGLDWTDKFGRLAGSLGIPGRAALDGEIVVLNDRGVSDFGALQAALSNHQTNQLVLFVFDLLSHDGEDLRTLPLLARRDRLEKLVEQSDGHQHTLFYSEHFRADGPDFHKNACHLALEGVVSKRADAPYRSGRSATWLKTKCRQRQEVVIGGFSERASGPGHVGALLVGVRENGKLRYVGRVGTGFSVATARTLRAELDQRRRDTSPFAGAVPRVRAVKWVEPELVCEAGFHGWTRDGVLRQASFEGIRMDKPATEIARERPVPITKVAATSARIPKAARTKRSSATRTSGRRTDAGPDLHGVRLTSPDRIVYKSQGLTKRDLADYYAAIADDILPHVAGRALSLVRCPGGSSAKCFYQKHRAKGMSDAIGTVRVRGKTKMDEYLTIHDARGLVELVQFGTLEFHPGGSRADDYERPDRLTFDLDPDTSLPWRDVAKAAAQVRDLLKELGLESFVKTTGGKGLHVVVPIKPDLKWPEAKAFSRVVAETLCARNPGQYTASIAKKARKGRIFIDYLRNERGSTSIAPYSTRASADAPVATPLTWAELAKGIDPADFNVKTLPGRLRRQKKDPWERFFKLRQAVPRATQAQRRAR